MPTDGAAPKKSRARDLGIVIGPFQTGPHNAMTDVAGVLVGHTTIDDGSRWHTGVTAIVPSQITAARPTLPCAIATGNGHGKLVGSTQVDELGTLETPILLTATLSVFRAADALLTYQMARPGYGDVRSINPVVGETNDGYLSDIRARPVTERDVWHALESAADGAVAEGCVGAGTGTAALGYKGGIGTSSRLVPLDGGPVTIGVLVQSNFSGTLRVLGVPMPAEELLAAVPAGHAGGDEVSAAQPDGNSCMIVLATDAAVDARQLGRIARRAVYALGRVGSDFAGGSGDYAIAFSTGDTSPSGGATGSAFAPTPAPLPEPYLDALFRAAGDAVEEALLNSLLAATDTVGVDGHRRRALPHAPMLARLRAAGRLPSH